MYVESGYKTITPSEIASCIHALNEHEISYRAVRVYFGCLALVAIREAAARSTVRARKGRPQTPRYQLCELCKLTGLAERAVRRELRALKRAGVLSFAEFSITTLAEERPAIITLAQALAGGRSCRRPIPVPRSVLRFLARSNKAVLGKTVLGYIARGMSISRETGEVRGVGTVKASWISEVMNVSLRAAKGARRELIALGFISKDTGSVQRKLNRDGAYFRVCLSWKGGSALVTVANPSVVVKGRRQGPEPEIAPPPAKNHTAFALPIKDTKTPYGSKDRKAWRAKPPGVSSKPAGGAGPDLRNVQMTDLQAFSRTEELYHQAVKASWIRDSEAELLKWVAAAVRAKTCRASDPVRVFVGIVRRGLWNHITDADEERARQAINRYRYGR